jgi:ribosomal-protein-alanine N-acetyltransferase
VTLNTRRLILRPIEPSDLEDLYAFHRQPNVGPSAGWKPHENRAETWAVLQEMFFDRPSMFGIVWRETGRMIGQIGLVEDPKRENPDAGMLGYAIREDFWNRGIVTEATRAVVAYGFLQRRLMLISAYCYPENHASRRVLEKCGFHYEGTLTLCERRYDGKIFDNECYSIGCAEWSGR